MENLKVILHARHDEDSTQVEFEVVDDSAGIYERFKVNVNYERDGIVNREEALRWAHLELASRLKTIAQELERKAYQQR